MLTPAIDQKSLPRQSNKAQVLCTVVHYREALPNGKITQGARCECDPTNPATQEVWVRSLVASYNTALREVYAEHSPRPKALYPPSSAAEEFSSWDGQQVSTTPKLGSKATDPALRRWRWRPFPSARPIPLFPILLRAATMLHDKGIAPYTWAKHVMERSRDYAASKGKAAKPLPAHVVFRPKDVEDPAQRAMFYQERQDYGHTVRPTHQHLEQLYRMRERDRRVRKLQAPLLGLPPWYVQLREAEIAQGSEDPMVNFPVIGKVVP